MRRNAGIAAAVVVLVALGLGAGFFLWGRGGAAHQTAPLAGRETSPETTAAPAAPSAAASAQRMAPSRSPQPGEAAKSATASSAEPRQSSQTAAAPQEAAAPSRNAQAPAGAAVAVAGDGIDGVVVLAGPAPVPGRLHREADPFCARTPMNDPSVLARDGKLANVWVHITEGAPDSPPPPAAVEMDQKDCMYTPRVTTAVVGQKIVAKNGDPVLHNVHAYFGPSTLFNRGMPNDKAPPVETTAQQAGLISWKCDVHPWMRGYLGVSKNAFQAVTGADGRFHIGHLPPGRYTIEAWHERYGAQSVQLAAPAQVTITYQAR